ncbi:MAG TPA: hypothetical protein VMH05_17175 [Bryobacteraceae bacterium]|nr:hypothetical protein [Bryobacteraceae bacterium]HUA61869.1 hypothetical protein [Verrucomicrobiae bacterium]
MTWCARPLPAVAVSVWLSLVFGALAQDPGTRPVDSATDTAAPPPPAAISVPLNEERILKVIPDYQTVDDTSHAIAPLTPAQKWDLALRETVDPFNIATAAMTAASSQRGNQTPKYGEGWANYGKRFGAAIGDFGTQNFFSAGVFATLLRQDPRYFRKGPTTGIAPRVWYSMTRLFVCRNDSGRPVFNASNLLGMSFGIAASNIYYPSASRTGTVMAARTETSLFGGFTGNVMSEFWPDLQRKFFRKKPKS